MAGMTVALFATVISSCAKRYDGDVFAPKQSATCDDGELNQGEYRVDCGGPCAPCDIQKAYVGFLVDRTWDPSDDTNYTYVRSDYALSIPNGDVLSIIAVDTGNSKFDVNYSIDFDINVKWKGVHEIAPATGSYSDWTSFVGTVGLETGVIEITNKDTINGWISGKFKFNSKPEVWDPTLGPGHRVAIIQGEFVDLPLYPEVP